MTWHDLVYSWLDLRELSLDSSPSKRQIPPSHDARGSPTSCGPRAFRFRGNRSNNSTSRPYPSACRLQPRYAGACMTSRCSTDA